MGQTQQVLVKAPKGPQHDHKPCKGSSAPVHQKKGEAPIGHKDVVAVGVYVNTHPQIC